MTKGEERSGWSYSCIVTTTLVFASLTVAVLLGLTDHIDDATRTAINSVASPALTALFDGLSFLGSVAVVYSLTALTIAVLWLRGARSAALRVIVVMGAAGILNNVVKMSIARTRPVPFFGDLPASYSFASGHALFSACFYGVLAGMLAAELPQAWQRAVVLGTAAVLIGGVGVSRIYLGVHYTSDVIAGFALAALIVCCVRGLIAK
jgi:undecaprenyl-diphosphatase